MENNENILADYIIVKALEDGVTLMGFSRGKETKISHTEKLAKGETMIAQFTENVSAMKIRGKAEVTTKYGKIDSESMIF